MVATIYSAERGVQNFLANCIQFVATARSTDINDNIHDDECCDQYVINVCKRHVIGFKFLNENVPNLMDWPANSPDLNPIKNLWNIVKRNVEKRMPQNQQDLSHFMVEEWNAIPKTTLINLVQSMKCRCDLVIKSNGERISY